MQGGDFLKGKEKSISRSELVVMNVLWREGRCPASRVVDQVAKHSDWHFRTVKTLLRNLVAKGFVGYEVDAQDSRIYYYTPLVDEEQYLQQERQQFLHLYYGGDRSSLLAGFLQDGKLSAAEAEKLRRMLNSSAEEE
ncbi:BlaI/MecI/CopY family transcriptional regulator [Paenibacillus antibioticophila]|uniref:BlaI/MecI/CopY family transcriptional regulator n=1 Tax=Paenibacillus antibioticophila TaxID=1274374 RepID=UPI00292A4848|nr:BlaI/MecI/CopY family transcriptional regulator [Paenibacillus antibioticophila]